MQVIRNKERVWPMPNLSRRSFIATGIAAGSMRSVPQLAKSPPAKRVVTLVYDHAKGMMRLVDRVVR